MEDGDNLYSLVQDFSLQHEDIIDTRFIGEDWHFHDLKALMADVLQRLAVIEAKLATDTK
jgi:hypothetical protein